MPTHSSASLSRGIATLCIDDEEIRVAAERLASRSDFFRVLFFGDFAERRAKVFTMTDDKSRALLTALHVESEPWPWEPASVPDAFDIHLIADKYFLPKARKACGVYLSRARPIEMITELIKGVDDWQQFDLVDSILRVFAKASAVVSFLSLDLSERAQDLVRQRAEALERKRAEDLSRYKIFLGVHGSRGGHQETLIFSLPRTALSEEFTQVVCGNGTVLNIRGGCYKFVGAWDSSGYVGHTPCPKEEGWFLHCDGGNTFEITRDTHRTTGHYFGELLPEEGDTPSECVGPINAYNHSCRRGLAADL